MNGDPDLETVPLVVEDWQVLQEALAEGIPCRVEGFRGDFRFLSNFFPSPIEYERMRFATVEHAYQAAKVIDSKEKERIAALATPGQAKKAGNRISLRRDWESLRLRIMEELVLLKFQSSVELSERLLATGNCFLEETNTWGDRFWGVSDGKGENHLGQILMRVRDRIRAERSS